MRRNIDKFKIFDGVNTHEFTLGKQGVTAIHADNHKVKIKKETTDILFNINFYDNVLINYI